MLTIRDLSRVSGKAMLSESERLYATWKSSWQGLGTEQTSSDAITESIDHMRDAAVSLIESLE